jgi:predicted HD phosphohydrolase
MLKSVANDIIDLYKKYGKSDYIGETITQNSHMIQAGMLAEKKYPKDIEFILAAFFHDIGHIVVNIMNDTYDSMDGYGVKNHENIGANYLLNLGFSHKIVSIVRNHVLAKRYLCSKNKYYYNKLSDASKQTFHKQGSYMSEEEILEFESEPLFKFYCTLRKIDDKAKKQVIELKSLDYFKSLIEKYILDNTS